MIPFSKALDLVWYQLQSAEIEVEQSFGSELPLITASNEHLKSVWINLVVNAVDALMELEGDRRLGIFTQLIPEGDPYSGSVSGQRRWHDVGAVGAYF